MNMRMLLGTTYLPPWHAIVRPVLSITIGTGDDNDDDDNDDDDNEVDGGDGRQEGVPLACSDQLLALPGITCCSVI